LGNPGRASEEMKNWQTKIEIEISKNPNLTQEIREEEVAERKAEYLILLKIPPVTRSTP